MELADLKFGEDGTTLSYRMKNNDQEMQELVNSLIKSTSKSSQQSPQEGEGYTASDDADGTPDP